MMTAAKSTAKQPAKKAARKAPAPKAEPPAITPTDLLPAGAVTDSPASGSYLRVKVLDRPVGYVSPRRKGRLVEVLTARLEGVKESLLEGTTARQNQTALLVTDKATAKQARALFAHAASTVPGVQS